MRRSSIFYTCLIWICLCLAISGLTGWVSSSHINGWYQTLIQPPFSPPKWLFAPVWTTLYVTIGLVGGVLWTLKKKYTALFFLYIVQLILNFSWSFIFFIAQNIGGALIDIFALWITLMLVIIVGVTQKKWIICLLLPYLFWVSFASVLNYSIWRLN